MLRWLAVYSVALGAVLLAIVAVGSPFADHAVAWEEWSADDPVVSINGNLMDIQVQMPVANIVTMRNTFLTVVIPSNVSGAVIVDDVSAFPMTTTISPTGPAWGGSGPIPVTIVVNVQASLAYETRMVATPLQAIGTPIAAATTVYGMANTPFNAAVTLGK